MKRIGKYLIFIIMCIFCGEVALCVPAFPQKISALNTSGDNIEILLKGDENFKYAVSADDYLLLPKDNSWYYCVYDSIEGIKPSVYEITPLNDESKPLKTFKQTQGLKQWETPIINQPNINKPLKANRALNKDFAKIGQFHSLVILMEYPDLKFQKTREDFENLFNEIGYTENKAKGSVRDYYKYASYGKFDLVSDIFGPFESIHRSEFYGENSNGSSDSNPLELAVEAIKMLPDDIDLSKYDVNDDGVVENVHIIFAGHGEEAGASPRAIWSHEYPYTLPIKVNGYSFAGYSCTPELRSNSGNNISRIGVICHELGHAFGANDYYDVDYEISGGYDGTGVWDIMADGCWNDNGRCPSNFNPYIKIYDFGWANELDITNVRTGLTLQSSNYSDTILCFDTDNKGDKYFIEYREQKSFDEYIPDKGLIIYHYNPLLESRKKENKINNTHPQCFYPVCAGADDSPKNKNYGDINSPACPFPGANNKRSFTYKTTPPIFAWSGQSNDIELTNISIYDGFATFKKNSTSSPELPEPEITHKYHESFENGIYDFEVVSIMGEEKWINYPNGKKYPASSIPAAKDGKHLLMLFGGQKTSSVSRSEIISPVIYLNNDSLYQLSCWANAIYQIDIKSPKLTLSYSINGSDEWVQALKIREWTKEWQQESVSLPQCSAIRYKITGDIDNSSIFIDDIIIDRTGELSTTDIEFQAGINYKLSEGNLQLTNTEGYAISVRLYLLNGRCIYDRTLNEYGTETLKLERGVYILSENGIVHKIII